MVEQAQAAKCHGNAVFVAGVNHLLVADGTAGLDNGGHAAAVRALNVVAEGEKRVAAQANAGDLAQPFFLLSLGQRFGLTGKGFSPNIVADHVFRRIADVNINGVVAVGFGNIVAERQIQHLGHMAQLPVVGLLAGQTGAVDAALLARAHADDLAVLHVAHAVGLRVFQGNQAQAPGRVSARRSGSCFRSPCFPACCCRSSGLLRPCSKVMPYTCLCSRETGT